MLLRPFEKLLLNGQTASEAMRINRSKAIPATIIIDRHLGRLSKMAKVAKYGDIVLTAVGVGCYNMAQTNSCQEKNKILVETLGSTAVGVVGSFVLGIVLVSNPVDWGLALTLGTTAAVASWGAGKGAVKVYDKYLNQHDLAKISGIDNICK